MNITDLIDMLTDLKADLDDDNMKVKIMVDGVMSNIEGVSVSNNKRGNCICLSDNDLDV